MRQASRAIGVSEAIVNHAENGRVDLSPTLIVRFLNGYGYTLDEFDAFCRGEREMQEDLLVECISMLKKMSPSKLRTVKTILSSF